MINLRHKRERTMAWRKIVPFLVVSVGLLCTLLLINVDNGNHVNTNLVSEYSQDHKSSPDLLRKHRQEVKKRMATMYTNIRQQCSRDDMKERSHLHEGSVIVIHKFKLMVCLTRKSGTQSWKRFLRAIQGLPTNSSWSICFDEFKHMSENDQDYVLQNYYKVMTVRQPVDRLWSAYSNKFTHGNLMFLSQYGKSIVEKFKTSPSLHNLRCGSNVTFTEFIHWIMYEQTHGIEPNSHWAPFYELCDPCNIRYDIISSTETMKTDMKYLTWELNAPQVKLQSSFSDIQEAALRTPILKTNSPLNVGFGQSQREFCFTFKWFLQTYLVSLIHNGFMEEAQASSMKDMFIDKSKTLGFGQTFNDWEIFRNYSYTTANNSLFSNKTFLEGYALLKDRKSSVRDNEIMNLPHMLLQKLLMLYKPDFLMFGYAGDYNSLTNL